ncbi:MAG: hypothetical protein IPH44_13680 [Myxococcales bacterium]|nr:hypothetical protein [Myxococcales bacterium]
MVDEWTETIDGEGLPELTILVGGLAVGVPGELWASAAVARSVFPTFDGNVAAEDRVSARFDGTLGAAASRWRCSPPAPAPDPRRWHLRRPRGGRVRVVRPPPSGRRGADVYGEFGLSPGARLDGDRAREPRSASRCWRWDRAGRALTGSCRPGRLRWWQRSVEAVDAAGLILAEALLVVVDWWAPAGRRQCGWCDRRDRRLGLAPAALA